MGTFKIITFNVRGLQYERSREKKVEFLKKLDYDILCLQEMTLKTNTDIKELNQVWNPGYSIISIASYCEYNQKKRHNSGTTPPC